MEDEARNVPSAALGAERSSAWLVSFMDDDLGFFNKDEGRVEPTPNPFTPVNALTLSRGAAYPERRRLICQIRVVSSNGTGASERRKPRDRSSYS
jgi:hypothetical protein